MNSSDQLRRVLLAAMGCTVFGIPRGSLAQAKLQPWSGPAAARPITLRALGGKPFALTELRGKVVLINFWATWCEPCIEELPSMQRLRDRLGTSNFEVVAVNYQEGEPRIRTFLQRVPLEFPIVRDTDGGVARAWNVRIFPTTFVVDAAQNIRYQLSGSLDWTSPEVERRVRALLPG
ncbi:MAG: TlpA family protein disulfide reductase [Gemmatimonadota bacterium]